MDCAEFEVLLADYVDGVLAGPALAKFEEHRESCPICAAYAEDAASAVAFMDRAETVEPPAELIGRILHATNSGWDLKLRGTGIRGWINRTFAPILQPRFVMGAMMTLMSLTMLSRCAGAPKKTITAADLDPVRLWSSLDDRTHRIWDRAVKSYESMRLVFEIKTEINEWKQQQAEAEEAAAEARANSRKIVPQKAAAPGGVSTAPAGVSDKTAAPAAEEKTR
jgi:hypothetical protein